MTAALAAIIASTALASPLAGVRREVLDNGLVVLLAEDHRLPLVSVGAMYRVGAKNEAAGTTGLAHYVEHMNFRDTRRFPGSESTAAVIRLGGRWSGYTWIDQTYYAETVPKEALGLALDIEADRMAGALFDPAEFTKERTSVIAELHSYDDPTSVLYDAVLAASFEIHPYRNNTIGWLSDVEGVTREAAYAFYRRFYHPNNAVLVVVGDMDAAATLAAVRRRFGGLPAAGENAEVGTREPAQTGQRRVTVRRPGPEGRVLLAFRAPALSDSDFPAMVLFDALLAGGKGFRFTRDYPAPPGTLLGRQVADAETDWQASRYPYVYTLAVSTPEEDGLAAREAALFRALAETGAREWTDAELFAARRQVAGGWAADIDDLAGRAHQLAFFEVAGGYRYLLEMPGRLARVTRDDVRRFARDRLTPEQATVGWFLPTPPQDRPSPTPPATAVATPGAEEPSGGIATPASLSTREALRLRNGLNVVLEPLGGAGLVALRGRIEAGSLYDGAKPGLSALATQLLAAPLVPETAGPSLTWTLHTAPTDSANARWIEFSATCLADEVMALLESVGDRLRRGFTDAVWLAAREAALRRARTLAGDAEADLWRRGLERLYASSSNPVAPAWGRVQSLEAITSAEARAFVEAHVRPERTQLVLAGAVPPLRRPRLERWLGAWPAGVRRPSLPSMPPRGPAEWTRETLPWPGKAQNEIAVVWPGERSKPWDRPATELLLYLLGETGYAGRLGRALVDPGLVYSVVATLEEPFGTDGFLMVRTAASPKDTPEVLARVRQILEEAGRGSFDDRELAEAKRYLRGKRLRARDGSVAAARATIEAAYASPSAFEGVTLEQLRDTARRLPARGAPLALVAGPVLQSGGRRSPARVGTARGGGGRSRTSPGRADRAGAGDR